MVDDWQPGLSRRSRVLLVTAAGLAGCGPSVLESPDAPVVIVGEIDAESFGSASRLIGRQGWALLNVIGPGDLDADGLDDVIAWEFDAKGADTTFIAYVFYGREEGLAARFGLEHADATLQLEPRVLSWPLGWFGESHELPVELRGLGDLNSDGAADFAIAVGEAEHGACLLVYEGGSRRSGAVHESDASASVCEPWALWIATVDAGDVDGDGSDDLAYMAGDGERTDIVISYGSSAFFGSGSPTVDRRWRVGDAQNHAFKAADLDGDGLSDFVIERDEDLDHTTVEVRYSKPREQTDETYPEPDATLTVAPNWTALDRGVIDFLGDGHTDLVLDAGGVGLLPHDASRYAGVIPPSNVRQPFGVLATRHGSAGDLDADGREELATTQYRVDQEGWIDLFYGAPTLTESVGPDASIRITTQLAGTSPVEAVGDINGDGFDDFVVTQHLVFGENGGEPISRSFFFYGAAR